MKDTLKELNTWGENFSNYKLPRWGELPEIDFYMDQVIEFTEKHLSIFSGEDSGKLISPSIINNYVKLKIIPPPTKKRYSREHISLLLIICILKPIMPIASIQNLVDIQLKSNSLENVYNRFCNEQEFISEKAIETANNNMSSLLESTSNHNEMLSILSLRMAVMSNSSKIIADKILSANNNEEDNDN